MSSINLVRKALFEKNIIKAQIFGISMLQKSKHNAVNTIMWLCC